MNASALRSLLALLLLPVLGAPLAGCSRAEREAAAAARATPPGGKAPLRFASREHRFVTPEASGPLRSVGLLPVSAYGLGYAPATQRLYSISRSGHVAWQVAACDLRGERVLETAPLPCRLEPFHLSEPTALLDRLRTGNDATIRYLRERLSPTARAAVEASASSPLSDEARAALLKDLNAVIEGPLLANDPRIELETKLKAVADEPLAAADTPWFNRLVLDTALSPGLLRLPEIPRELTVHSEERRLYVNGWGCFWPLEIPSLRNLPTLVPTGTPPDDAGDFARLYPRNPRTGYAYKLADWSHRLHVYDSRTLKPVATVSFPGIKGSLGAAVAVEPERNEVYVAHAEARNAVSVVDGRTHRVLRQLPVGRAPSQIGIDARTGRLFVTDVRDYGLRILNARTGERLGFMEFDDLPRQVVVVPETGRIFVRLECGIVVVLAQQDA